jgi:pre-mRNA-splicing factor ATP-dependent RNA helicase DHX38/PRP16
MKNQPRENLEQKHRNEEHTKWEENQLINSGIFKVSTANNEGAEDEENRVMLMVHDLRPPFLDGKTQFSTNMETIQVVKDPNSDMALLAKKGSLIVKELR